MKEKYGYIYITTNLIEGKRYIEQHKSDKFEPNKYMGSGIYFLNALKKYGKNNFKCELLEWCGTKEQLNEREKYWISYYNAQSDDSFYNLREGGSGEILFTESSLERISKNNIGKHFKSEEQRKQHSLKMKGFKAMLGKHMSEETKKKQSQAKLGKKIGPRSEATKQAQREKMLGRHPSKETILKRASKIKGHTLPKNVRDKISKSKSRKVICIETGTIYPSIKSTKLSSVPHAIKYNKTAGGYHWAYYD